MNENYIIDRDSLAKRGGVTHGTLCKVTAESADNRMYESICYYDKNLPYKAFRQVRKDGKMSVAIRMVLGKIIKIEKVATIDEVPTHLRYWED